VPDPFTARARAGRARIRRLRWWLAAVVVLLVAVVYVVAFSPLLAVKDVSVTGADKPVTRMARENADVRMGRPLARVDTEAIADRVAEDLRIRTVEVSRSWPSTLSIELTLRTPRAVLTQPGRPARLVDGSGVAYEAVANRPEDLPEIAAPSGSVNAESLAGAVQARRALDPSWREEVSSMQVSSEGDVQFRIGSVAVQWGGPEGHEAKAAALQALLAQDGIDPGGDSSLTVDVTAPQTPVVTGLSPAPPE
jgi:cell division protein FtsQ